MTHMDRPDHVTELYTPRRESKGPDFDQGWVCGNFSTFAESFRILAENSGLPTRVVDLLVHHLAGPLHLWGPKVF